MAKFLVFGTGVTITDGGEAALGASAQLSLADQEIEEFSWGTYRVGASGEKFVAVIGGAGVETDPVIVPLSIIEGFQLESNVPVDIAIDAAVAGVQVLAASQHGMQASSIKISGLGQVADVKLLVWGKR